MSTTSTPNSEDGPKQVLQKLGENAAYTFKGLYKTSDWLECIYRLCVAVPFLLSFLTLGDLVHGILAKVLAVASLMFSVALIANQNSFSAITEYRRLANEFKAIYDEIERKYHCRDFTELESLSKRFQQLLKETSGFPISRVGYWWARRVITREMDLNWIHEGRRYGRASVQPEQGGFGAIEHHHTSGGSNQGMNAGAA